MALSKYHNTCLFVIYAFISPMLYTTVIQNCYTKRLYKTVIQNCYTIILYKIVRQNTSPEAGAYILCYAVILFNTFLVLHPHFEYQVRNCKQPHLMQHAWHKRRSRACRCHHVVAGFQVATGLNKTPSNANGQLDCSAI